MRKRREILKETGQEAEDDTSDAVLNGQVAFIVFKQAQENIPGNFCNPLIHSCLPCIHFIQYHKFTKCNRNVSSVSWTKILHVFASCLWNQMHLPLITRITALTYLSGIIYYLWLPVENLKNCRLSVAFCKTTTTAKKGLQWKHIFNPKTNA